MPKLIAQLMTTLFLTWWGCTTPPVNNEKLIGYNLSSPDHSFELPDILREVSGITSIDSTSFACVQDEDGVLFIYDLANNEIKRQYSFHFEGDYEGITRVGKTIYILRSDGQIYEIADFESPDFQLASYETNIPADNNEGLCYDPENDRLLIAIKGKADKGADNKDKRLIYGFDLKTKTLSSEPVFEFDVETIKQFARSHKVNLPTRSRKKKKDEPIIRFRTSAIGIHPLTGKLFLLSASDHLFFIFNKNGQIEYMEYLHPELFNKAEGITFFENGDMLITNEGQDDQPTLLRFNYRND